MSTWQTTTTGASTTFTVLSFVVCSPADDVQTDDFYVFVEQVGEGQNREIYRKVSIVVEIEDEDIVIAGLVPVEYQALESIFAHNNVLVAYAIDKRADDIELMGEPAFLPMLGAPPLDPQQTNDYLGVVTWPDGQYSIMLKCYMTPVAAGQQDVTITESLIMCRTARELEGELVDMFLSVDHRFLLAGKLKDAFGNELIATFGAPDGQDEEDDVFLEEEESDEVDETDLDGTMADGVQEGF